jgi:4-amino-4-deoxy-L-arabinose transferase-like glycosyltransferase
MRRFGGLGPALAAVVALALVVRVGYIVAVESDPLCCDRLFYHQTANQLADGHGYVKPLEFGQGRSLPTAGHPPLYPFLLAGMSWLGGTSYGAHRTLGVVVGALVVLLVGLLARRVAGERAGIAAALIAALHPTLIGADGAGMSEPLYGLGVAGVLLLALRLMDRPATGRALALGVAIGLTALVRGEAVLFLALLALPPLGRDASGRGRRALLACAATALVIVPWMARNWIAFDRPVGISTNYSGVLAGANCPGSYGGRDIGSWQQACFSLPPRDNEAEQATILVRGAVRYASEHPERLPLVAGARLLRTWSLWQPRAATRVNEGRRPGFEQAGLAVYYVLVLLALYGVAVMRHRRDVLAILLSPVVLACLVSLVGFGHPRFRHGAEISIAVLASAGLVRISDRVRGRRDAEARA